MDTKRGRGSSRDPVDPKKPSTSHAATQSTHNCPICGTTQDRCCLCGRLGMLDRPIEIDNHWIEHHCWTSFIYHLHLELDGVEYKCKSNACRVTMRPLVASRLGKCTFHLLQRGKKLGLEKEAVVRRMKSTEVEEKKRARDQENADTAEEENDPNLPEPSPPFVGRPRKNPVAQRKRKADDIDGEGPSQPESLDQMVGQQNGKEPPPKSPAAQQKTSGPQPVGHLTQQQIRDQYPEVGAGPSRAQQAARRPPLQGNGRPPDRRPVQSSTVSSSTVSSSQQPGDAPRSTFRFVTAVPAPQPMGTVPPRPGPGLSNGRVTAHPGQRGSGGVPQNGTRAPLPATSPSLPVATVHAPPRSTAINGSIGLQPRAQDELDHVAPLLVTRSSQYQRRPPDGRPIHLNTDGWTQEMLDRYPNAREQAERAARARFPVKTVPQPPIIYHKRPDGSLLRVHAKQELPIARPQGYKVVQRSTQSVQQLGPPLRPPQPQLPSPPVPVNGGADDDIIWEEGPQQMEPEGNLPPESNVVQEQPEAPEPVLVSPAYPEDQRLSGAETSNGGGEPQTKEEVADEQEQEEVEPEQQADDWNASPQEVAKELLSQLHVSETATVPSTQPEDHSLPATRTSNGGGELQEAACELKLEEIKQEQQEDVWNALPREPSIVQEQPEAVEPVPVSSLPPEDRRLTRTRLNGGEEPQPREKAAAEQELEEIEPEQEDYWNAPPQEPSVLQEQLSQPEGPEPLTEPVLQADDHHPPGVLNRREEPAPIEEASEQEEEEMEAEPAEDDCNASPQRPSASPPSSPTVDRFPLPDCGPRSPPSSSYLLSPNGRPLQPSDYFIRLCCQREHGAQSLEQQAGPSGIQMTSQSPVELPTGAGGIPTTTAAPPSSDEASLSGGTDTSPDGTPPPLPKQEVEENAQEDPVEAPEPRRAENPRTKGRTEDDKTCQFCAYYPFTTRLEVKNKHKSTMFNSCTACELFLSACGQTTWGKWALCPRSQHCDWLRESCSFCRLKEALEQQFGGKNVQNSPINRMLQWYLAGQVDTEAHLSNSQELVPRELPLHPGDVPRSLEAEQHLTGFCDICGQKTDVHLLKPSSSTIICIPCEGKFKKALSKEGPSQCANRKKKEDTCPAGTDCAFCDIEMTFAMGAMPALEEIAKDSAAYHLIRRTALYQRKLFPASDRRDSREGWEEASTTTGSRVSTPKGEQGKVKKMKTRRERGLRLEDEELEEGSEEGGQADEPGPSRKRARTVSEKAEPDEGANLQVNPGRKAPPLEFIEEEQTEVKLEGNGPAGNERTDGVLSPVEDGTPLENVLIEDPDQRSYRNEHVDEQGPSSKETGEQRKNGEAHPEREDTPQVEEVEEDQMEQELEEDEPDEISEPYGDEMLNGSLSPVEEDTPREDAPTGILDQPYRNGHVDEALYVEFPPEEPPSREQRQNGEDHPEREAACPADADEVLAEEEDGAEPGMDEADPVVEPGPSRQLTETEALVARVQAELKKAAEDLRDSEKWRRILEGEVEEEPDEVEGREGELANLPTEPVQGKGNEENEDDMSNYVPTEQNDVQRATPMIKGTRENRERPGPSRINREIGELRGRQIDQEESQWPARESSFSWHDAQDGHLVEMEDRIRGSPDLENEAEHFYADEEELMDDEEVDVERISPGAPAEEDYPVNEQRALSPSSPEQNYEDSETLGNPQCSGPFEQGDLRAGNSEDDLFLPPRAEELVVAGYGRPSSSRQSYSRWPYFQSNREIQEDDERSPPPAQEENLQGEPETYEDDQIQEELRVIDELEEPAETDQPVEEGDDDGEEQAEEEPQSEEPQPATVSQAVAGQPVVMDQPVEEPAGLAQPTVQSDKQPQTTMEDQSAVVPPPARETQTIAADQPGPSSSTAKAAPRHKFRMAEILLPDLVETFKCLKDYNPSTSTDDLPISRKTIISYDPIDKTKWRTGHLGAAQQQPAQQRPEEEDDDIIFVGVVKKPPQERRTVPRRSAEDDLLRVEPAQLRKDTSKHVDEPLQPVEEASVSVEEANLEDATEHVKEPNRRLEEAPEPEEDPLHPLGDTDQPFQPVDDSLKFLDEPYTPLNAALQLLEEPRPTREYSTHREDPLQPGDDDLEPVEEPHPVSEDAGFDSVFYQGLEDEAGPSHQVREAGHPRDGLLGEMPIAVHMEEDPQLAIMETVRSFEEPQRYEEPRRPGRRGRPRRYPVEEPPKPVAEHLRRGRPPREEEQPRPSPRRPPGEEGHLRTTDNIIGSEAVGEEEDNRPKKERTSLGLVFRLGGWRDICTENTKAKDLNKKRLKKTVLTKGTKVHTCPVNAPNQPLFCNQCSHRQLEQWPRWPKDDDNPVLPSSSQAGPPHRGKRPHPDQEQPQKRRREEPPGDQDRDDGQHSSLPGDSQGYHEAQEEDGGEPDEPKAGPSGSQPWCGEQLEGHQEEPVASQDRKREIERDGRASQESAAALQLWEASTSRNWVVPDDTKCVVCWTLKRAKGSLICVPCTVKHCPKCVRVRRVCKCLGGPPPLPRPLPPVVYVRGDPNKAGPGRAPVETPGWSTVIAVPISSPPSATSPSTSRRETPARETLYPLPSARPSPAPEASAPSAVSRPARQRAVHPVADQVPALFGHLRSRPEDSVLPRTRNARVFSPLMGIFHESFFNDFTDFFEITPEIRAPPADIQSDMKFIETDREFQDWLRPFKQELEEAAKKFKDYVIRLHEAFGFNMKKDDWLKACQDVLPYVLALLAMTAINPSSMTVTTKKAPYRCLSFMWDDEKQAEKSLGMDKKAKIQLFFSFLQVLGPLMKSFRSESAICQIIHFLILEKTGADRKTTDSLMSSILQSTQMEMPTWDTLMGALKSHFDLLKYLVDNLLDL